MSGPRNTPPPHPTHTHIYIRPHTPSIHPGLSPPSVQYVFVCLPSVCRQCEALSLRHNDRPLWKALLLALSEIDAHLLAINKTLPLPFGLRKNTLHPPNRYLRFPHLPRVYAPALLITKRFIYLLSTGSFFTSQTALSHVITVMTQEDLLYVLSGRCAILANLG